MNRAASPKRSTRTPAREKSLCARDITTPPFPSATATKRRAGCKSACAKGFSMKKIFSLPVLIALFLAPVRPVAAAAPAKVYMVLWDGCEEACRGFVDYLQSVRLPVDIARRDLKKDASGVPELVDEVKRTKPDLLVTWGTMATLEMLGTENGADGSRYGGMPAVFMVVSQPVESGLVSSLSAQGRNITGVTHLPDLYEQLQSARRVLPFKRLGVIYNPAETNARVAVAGLKKYADVMRFELIARPVL
ncbi:MAG TPA: hypothetical protein DCX19_02840, partial [Alphaproteobacteria bacterium]|nr:hypothetical protein [Alphaproteobacteria bacterium]